LLSGALPQSPITAHFNSTSSKPHGNVAQSQLVEKMWTPFVLCAIFENIFSTSKLSG